MSQTCFASDLLMWLTPLFVIWWPVIHWLVIYVFHPHVTPWTRVECVAKYQMCHRPYFSCSSLVKIESAWQHHEELKLKQKSTSLWTLVKRLILSSASSCQTPHLEMRPKIFSGKRSARLGFPADPLHSCHMPLWMSDCSLHSKFSISTEVVTGLFSYWYGWCCVKGLPSWRMFCVHHITLH